jgi:hypothetical protein
MQNSDKVSAVHLTGHVADIEEIIGISAFRFQVDKKVVSMEHRKSRYPKVESGPSIFQGCVA